MYVYICVHIYITYKTHTRVAFYMHVQNQLFCVPFATTGPNTEHHGSHGSLGEAQILR
jgi:hypothetical protein